MKKLFLFIVSVMLFSTTTLIAQELTLTTFGVSPRDVERDTVQYFDRVYNGLINVGTETKMFFKGHFEDSTLVTPVWTLFEKPAGSTADLGTPLVMDASTQFNSLIPDVVGTYKVEFADGTFADTLRLNAAKYLGVEGGPVSCVTCHNVVEWDFKYDKWQGTHHARALEEGLDGEKGSLFNNNCVQCHSVGYDVLANNDGFDDWPFVFPGTLMPGMYDSLLTVYPEAMARGNIQCEQCHGPGSGHFGNRFNIAKSMSVDVCARCHNSGTDYVIAEQWKHSGEDAWEFDGRGFEGGHGKGAFFERMGVRAGCAPCHSGAGHVQWVNEGRPVDEYGLPAAITIIPEPTKHTCATCHDPHDATNEHQLRFADTQLGDGTPVTMELYGAGAVCMQCHRSRRNAATYSADPDNASSHYGAHHGPEADLLLAANFPDFKDEEGNSIVFPSSPHAVAVLPGHDQGDACVNCHMGGEDKVDSEGNVILVGGHSWNMNDAEGNDHVQACAPCHGNIGTSFKDKKYYLNGNADHDGNGTAEGFQLEVHGLMEQLALLLPPVGESEVLLTDPLLDPGVFKAGYVYFWIEEDRSSGIHNPAFAFSLLKAAIEEVGGVVSAEYPESGMPKEYQLSQNYPNPFNPSTTIEYSLPEYANVTITIYDVLGNELDVLYSGEMEAGVHRLTWNASIYASGIYFYKMSSDNFIQVKKMLLLK